MVTWRVEPPTTEDVRIGFEPVINGLLLDKLCDKRSMCGIAGLLAGDGTAEMLLVDAGSMCEFSEDIAKSMYNLMLCTRIFANTWNYRQVLNKLVVIMG